MKDRLFYLCQDVCALAIIGSVTIGKRVKSCQFEFEKDKCVVLDLVTYISFLSLLRDVISWLHYNSDTTPNNTTLGTLDLTFKETKNSKTCLLKIKGSTNLILLSHDGAPCDKSPSNEQHDQLLLSLHILRCFYSLSYTIFGFDYEESVYISNLICELLKEDDGWQKFDMWNKYLYTEDFKQTILQKVFKSNKDKNEYKHFDITVIHNKENIKILMLLYELIEAKEDDSQSVSLLN